MERIEWKEIMKSKAKQGQVFKEEDSNQVKSCQEGRKNESLDICLWSSLSEWREIRRGGRNRLMVPDERDLSKLL